MKINNATPVVNNNIAKNNQGASFGSGVDKSLLIKGKECFDEFFTLSKDGAMGRKLFIFNAFAFLLGGRLARSRDKNQVKGQNGQPPTVMDYIRDKNEIRETLVRDVPTIVIAVMGVPVLQELFAGLIQKRTGFAIKTESGKLDKAGNPKMITAGYSTIEDLYKFDKGNAPQSGIIGFSKRLEKLGGRLTDIYSTLGEEIKTGLADCIDNKAVIERLSSNNELQNKVINALGKDNAALKRASFLITAPALIGYGLTLGLIGMFIPKFNIHLTEKLNKNKEINKQAEVKTQTIDTSKALQATAEPKTEGNLIAMKQNLK